MTKSASQSIALFDVRLDASVSDVDKEVIHYVDGTSRELPVELAHLDALTHRWHPLDQLLRSGFTTWQLARLFEAGIVECGRAEYVFPKRARGYFERQFPERAQFKAFSTWLGSPVPEVIWFGLPHANLADLHHSTATGLAAVVDAMPLNASILGILPELEPTPRCAADLRSLVGLAKHCAFKLGIIGGDHRATWSLLSVLKAACGAQKVLYVHIDAHHDLYGIEQTAEPRGIYHSNFLIDLLERRHVDRARLLGCRDGITSVKLAQAAGHDVATIRSPEALGGEWNALGVHTHLSIDIDVLDPTLFGGVSCPLNDGWTLQELLSVVHGVTRAVRVDSVSIVEVGSGCHDTVAAVADLLRLLETSL